jgi:hypothetical protein
MKALILLSFFLFSLQNFAAMDKRLWDYANNPDRLRDNDPTSNYITYFYDLPLKSQLRNTPWSGDYWPSYHGGISYRWFDYLSDWYGHDRYGYDLYTRQEVFDLDFESMKMLSPAEKYDLYLGEYNFPLVQYERNRTSIMRIVEDSPVYDPEYEIPSWEGLCHGWAPATLLYENPKAFVVENKDGLVIPFGSSDMKALLTFFLHYNDNSSSYFLGRRCNIDFSELQSKLDNGEITEQEYLDRLEMAQCRGVNAGSFHVILANQIGIQQQGFVADVIRDLEVWNQPVIGHEFMILGEQDPNEAQLSYGVDKVIKVDARMQYVIETGSSWYPDMDPYALTYKYYSYLLELDAEGHIIGGEWLSYERPDFFWRRERPNFEGYFKELEKLYELAM